MQIVRERGYTALAAQSMALYRFLFLTRTQGREYGTMKSMRRLQELVRTTDVNIYSITAEESDICFRDLYFAVHSNQRDSRFCGGYIIFSL